VGRAANVEGIKGKREQIQRSIETTFGRRKAHHIRCDSALP
jgi:hypothetical protein